MMSSRRSARASTSSAGHSTQASSAARASRPSSGSGAPASASSSGSSFSVHHATTDGLQPVGITRKPPAKLRPRQRSGCTVARVSAWSLTGRSALWAAVFLAAHPGATVAVAGAAQTPQNPAAYVNPFVGTSGGGNTFPGPVAPGGMIALGPDTVASASPPTGSAQPSGYDYGSSQLRGFSLDRMSGAGCAEFGDVPITPTTAAVTASPVSSPTSTDINSSYFSSFSHTEARASPGFYSVALHPASGPGPIGAELTTASRSAMARFSFPASAGSSTLIFNAAGSPTGNQAASVAPDPARNLVTGSSPNRGFCASPDHYTVSFAARVDRPF